MNLDDARVVLTVLSFLAFIGIAAWAYSRRRKRDFDEAANLPFTGHDFDASSGQTSAKREPHE